MKRLIVFGLLLCVFSASAQDHYQFPAGTQMFDLSGDHFITHRIAGNKGYLEERDLTGAVLWSDSLNNDGALSLDRVYIERFGQTSNYRIFLQGSFTTDSMIVQHATLSLSDHQLQAFRTDTLSGQVYLSTCSPTDTSVYLFTNRHPGINLRMHDVFSISVDGTMETVIADFETNPTNTFRYQFFSRAGGIYELYNNYSDLYSRKFDLQLQSIAATDSTDCVEEYSYSAPLLKQMKGEDSLFVLYYSYDFATDDNAWVFAWFTAELEELLVYDRIYTTNVYPYYVLNFNDVVLTSEYIYLLSYFTDGLPTPDTRRMFVYDHSFQLVCDYETAASEEDHLHLLKGETYILRDDITGVELFRADVCGIAGLNEETASGIEVFPNPTQGEVRIGFEPGTVQTIEVCDLNGKCLLVVPVEHATGTLTMDLSGFENGIYLLKAVGEKATKISRVVLQH